MTLTVWIIHYQKQRQFIFTRKGEEKAQQYQRGDYVLLSPKFSEVKLQELNSKPRGELIFRSDEPLPLFLLSCGYILFISVSWFNFPLSS